MGSSHRTLNEGFGRVEEAMIWASTSNVRACRALTTKNRSCSPQT